MNKRKSKTLACPFCAGKKSRLDEYEGDWFRNCLTCGASMRGRNRRKATEYWNKRAGGQKPDAPKITATNHVGISDLLAAIHRRFKVNGKEEARNVMALRKARKAIAAHDAATRGTVWFCAANVIADEMAANDGAMPREGNYEPKSLNEVRKLAREAMDNLVKNFPNNKSV